MVKNIHVLLYKVEQVSDMKMGPIDNSGDTMEQIMLETV